MNRQVGRHAASAQPSPERGTFHHIGAVGTDPCPSGDHGGTFVLLAGSGSSLDTGPVLKSEGDVMREEPSSQDHQASARAALRALAIRAQNGADQAALDAKAEDAARDLDRERHLSEEKLRRRVTL